MPFQPFLIAPYKDGQRSDTAPWLLPADAWEEVTDCYFKNGVLKKRSGYTEYGRFVEASSTITAATKADPVVITSASHGLSDGTAVFISGVSGMTELNGNSYFVSAAAANTFELTDVDGNDIDGSGFGVFSGTAILSTFTPDSILGIFTYYDVTGTEDLFVFNKGRLCNWDVDNDYLAPVVTVSHVIGYGDGTTVAFTIAAGLLPWLPAEELTGTVTVVAETTAGLTATLTDDGVTPTAGFGGDGTGSFVWADGATTATFNTAPGTGVPVYLNYTYYGDLWTGTDSDLFKALNYDFTITNLSASQISSTNAIWFTNGIDRLTYWDGTRLVVPLIDPDNDPGLYTSANKVNSCRDLTVTKERLVLYATLEGSERQEQRVRWCQAGAPTKWFTGTAGQGDYTDVATGSNIMWARKLRDTTVIAFQKGLFLQSWTGDPNLAFRIDQITEDTITDARNAVVGFDDFVVGVGSHGFYAVDGRTTRRIDDKLPDFARQDLDQTYFDKMTAWKISNRDEIWFGYVPGSGSNPLTYPRRVLIWNYKDDAWSIFNMPFTSFGSFFTSGDRVLSDFGDEELLSSFNHETLQYWQWQDNAPILLAGTSDEFGLGGRIWNLQRAALDHLSNKIATPSAITKANPCQVTTVYPHGLSTSDSILFVGVGGMIDLNQNMYTVTVLDTTNFTLDETDSSGFTTFTSGGDIFLSGPIDFSLKSARWNPFNEAGRDTRLGWIDFYVNSDPDNEVSVDFYSTDGGDKYQTKTLSFDGDGTHNWKRLHSGAVGNVHSINIYDTGSAGEDVEIHALRLAVEQAGRGVL